MTRERAEANREDDARDEDYSVPPPLRWRPAGPPPQDARTAALIRLQRLLRDPAVAARLESPQPLSWELHWLRRLSRSLSPATRRSR
jgi:hypothetical protein